VTIRKFAPVPASNPNTSQMCRRKIRIMLPRPRQHSLLCAPASKLRLAGSYSLLPTTCRRRRSRFRRAFQGTIEQQVNPISPREALALRVEGRVLLQAVVAEDRTVLTAGVGLISVGRRHRWSQPSTPKSTTTMWMAKRISLTQRNHRFLRHSLEWYSRKSLLSQSLGCRGRAPFAHIVLAG